MRTSVHGEGDARVERALGEGSQWEQTPFILALGSNLDDRRSHLEAGLAFLGRHLVIEETSRIVESDAWGPVPQGPFLNLVARGQAEGGVLDLLNEVQAAEGQAGRVRSERFGPRTLDVDIIFFGDAVIESSLLTVPHPRWAERPFVSALLPDVSGGFEEPRSGRRITEIVPPGPLPSSLREVPPLAWRSRGPDKTAVSR